MDDTWRVLEALGAGPALPNRFNPLERLLESAVQSVRLKSTPEVQMSGILAFCEEMQRILKIAFIENGFLAREIEEVTQAYQTRMTAYEGKIKHLEQQNKTVTAKVLKLGRKLQKMAQPRKVPTGRSDASTNTLPCGMVEAETQWTANKKASDYDTLNALSDCQAPDFDQMVRFNTLLIDFIHDEDREQLALPLMSGEERSELARLCSVYKVRCRFGKENIASVQLIKGRQSCLPAPGELDSIMSKYVTIQGERRSAQLPRKPDPQPCGGTPCAEKRTQVKDESEEELLLCSETVLQTSSNDIQSPSPLPPKATSLPNLAPSSMSRTPTQSTVGETAASLQGAKDDGPTASEGSAVSCQSAQKTLQQERIGGTDSPLLVEERVPSPSAGKEGGILGAGLAGERSAGKGKKSVPKVKRLLACTITLPATKRIKMKQTRSSCRYTRRISLCSLLCLATTEVAIFTIPFPFPLPTEIEPRIIGPGPCRSAGCMWLSCRAFWRVCDSTLRLRLISTSFPVAMAEAEKPPDEERLVDTESDERSGDVPKVPKLQTHTSDTTSSRDERPVPELRKHQTDTGGRGTKEDLKESNVMRVLKVQQRAEQYVSMLREEKRKLYRCGKKYTTLGTVSTLKEDIESGHVIQNDALREGDDPELCSKVSLWRGDITRLEIDAIVNAANSSLLGGGGVDGAIHSAAGLMLREECETLGGCSAGDAKVTAGYKLPAKYVIHTVGPMMEKSRVLQSCYLRSFQLVKEKMIRSVAFPCIATGIYGYPNEKAAHIALETTKEWLMEHKDEVDRVVFCVFLDRDHRIYSELMPKYFPTATPPLPPSKSRREEKGEGREGARQTGSGGSSPSEEMDQSGMACQRAGGPSGNEERGHFEKDSSPNEEGVRETPADEPGWLFSLIQRLLAWLTRWWGTTVRRG